MSTDDIVETYLQQLRQKAGDEALAEALIDVYTERFGTPPAEVAEQVVRTRDRATLRAWLKLAALGSAEEIQSAIRTHSAS